MLGYHIIMNNFYSTALNVFTYDQQISQALRAIGEESGRILQACILYILHSINRKVINIKVSTNPIVALLYTKSKWKRVPNIPIATKRFQASGNQNEDRKKIEKRDKEKSTNVTILIY